jgi:hypothetical protein
MSKMQIVIDLDNLNISACGNYYNMPISIAEDKIKLIGINKDASAFINKGRIIIRKGAKAAAAAKADNNTARIDNIEKALGSIIELLASQNKAKAKAK